MYINSFFGNETLIQSGISGPKSPLRGNILSFEGPCCCRQKNFDINGRNFVGI